MVTNPRAAMMRSALRSFSSASSRRATREWRARARAARSPRASSSISRPTASKGSSPRIPTRVRRCATSRRRSIPTSTSSNPPAASRDATARIWPTGSRPAIPGASTLSCSKPGSPCRLAIPQTPGAAWTSSIARSATRQGALLRAADIYGRVAPRDSGHEAALSNLGALALSQNDPASALRYLDRALKVALAAGAGVATDIARIQSRRGRALGELGRLPEAREAFIEARRLFAATLGVDHGARPRRAPLREHCCRRTPLSQRRGGSRLPAAGERRAPAGSRGALRALPRRDRPHRSAAGVLARPASWPSGFRPVVTPLSHRGAAPDKPG